jgi:hypothetical protein
MDAKVNAKQWNSLSADDKKRIETVITSTFGQSARVVPDANAPELSMQTMGFQPQGNFICEAACGVAEAAAVAACAGLGNPIAVAACIAVAKEAGKECRRGC